MPPPPSTPKSKHKRQTSNPQTPSPEKQRLNGLLKDGLVYCNCEPRAEARLFETKKEGPNQGKWFYRCARSGKFKCNFFLWESEKLEREAGLTPAQKKEADKEAVVHGPSKTPKSYTPKMTQRKLASFGYTKRRRNSDEITTSSGSDSEGAAEAASKGKRKLDAFEEDSEKDSFGSFDSEDEQELAAMADETAEKAAATPAVTKVVAGLPTPSTTRTLFPGAQEERVAKRQRTMGFDDLPDTPSKPPNDGPSSSPATIQAPSTATTKTVSFSSPPAPTATADADADAATTTTTNNSNPLDAMASILQNYTLSEPDAAALRNLLVVETRKRAGAEKSRDFKQTLCNEKDARIAKLQEEVAALRNKERVMHGQITEMRAKVMRHYQDFGNI